MSLVKIESDRPGKPFTKVVPTMLRTGINTATAPVIMIEEATTSLAAFIPYLYLAHKNCAAVPIGKNRRK
jgi:hypothetical protein